MNNRIARSPRSRFVSVFFLILLTALITTVAASAVANEPPPPPQPTLTRSLVSIVEIEIRDTADLQLAQEFDLPCTEIGLCTAEIPRPMHKQLDQAGLELSLKEQAVKVAFDNEPMFHGDDLHGTGYIYSGANREIPDHDGTNPGYLEIDVYDWQDMPPQGTKVTRVEYNTRVQHGWVSDLILAIRNDQNHQAVLWHENGGKTDNGEDDDAQDDDDVLLDRSTNLFYSDNVHQTWTMQMWDTDQGATGKLWYLNLYLFYDEAPDNDDFNNAFDIRGKTLPYSHRQSTSLASTAGDDPRIKCGQFGPSKGTNSVWFKAKPTANGTLKVDTLQNTNFDTVIAIFTGTRGSLSQKACSDDIYGSTRSQVSYDIQAGKTYYIEVVGKYANSHGTVTVRFDFEPHSGCGAITQIPAAECEALEALMHNTNIGSKNWNWFKTNKPCNDWTGVVCNSGHVTGLALSNKGVDGTLPQKIGQLTKLEIMELSENILHGTLPDSLGSMYRLRIINLFDNQFSGQLSRSLNSFNDLEILSLANNDFSGDLPELGASNKLEAVYLQNNRFSGGVPELWNRFNNLESLYINNNNLSGRLPVALKEIGPSLKHFHYNNTELCEPSDPTFQAWLTGIQDHAGTGIDCCEIPAEPELLSPPDKSFFANEPAQNPPTLTWERIPYATEYRLEIARDPGFSNNAYRETLSEPRFTPPAPFAEGTFYWRVFARNKAGSCYEESGWSSARQFSIDDSEPSISNVRMDVNRVYTSACEPNQFNVTASVLDDISGSGLADVTIHITKLGTGVTVHRAMAHESGNTYKAKIGPYDRGGRLSFYITAEDKAGNKQKTIYINYKEIEGCKITNLTMSIHRSLSADDKAVYEEILKYFADAVYEMTNGAHQIGAVTIYTGTGNSPRTGSDVFWASSGWPHAYVSGIENKDKTASMFENWTDGTKISNKANRIRIGYAMAHEWAHYYYGLFDEYPGNCDGLTKAQCDARQKDPNALHLKDAHLNTFMGNPPASEDSKLLHQMNFSSAKVYEDCDNNAADKKPCATSQLRLYGASAWETLARPNSQDPKSINMRPTYPELAKVAPKAGQYASFELPGARTTARQHLDLVWIGKATTTDSASGNPFWAGVQSLHGEVIAYPQPAVLIATVASGFHITGANVVATVNYPDGTVRTIALRDDGITPDTLAEDGFYSSNMPYGENGIHDVTVNFDNHAGTALYTDAGRQYLPEPVGDFPFGNYREPVGEDFDETASISLDVQQVAEDDHGGSRATATPLLLDNADIYGRIDFAGDDDVFKIESETDRDIIIRLSGLADGMQAYIGIYDKDAQEIKAYLYEPVEDDYFFMPFTMTGGEPYYIAVAHQDSTAETGLYEVSAGDALVGTAETNKKKVLFDEAHGEEYTLFYDKAVAVNPLHPDWVYYGSLARDLADQFDLEANIDQPFTDELLAGYDALIIPGALEELPAAELSAVHRYVNSGGGLLVLGGCWQADQANPILQPYGITLDPPCIFGEPWPDTPGPNGDFEVFDFSDHDAVFGITRMVTNWGASLEVGPTAEVLARTDDTIWQDENGNDKRDPGEASGPFIIAAAFDKDSRRVVALHGGPFQNDGYEWRDNEPLMRAFLNWLTGGSRQTATSKQELFMPLVRGR